MSLEHDVVSGNSAGSDETGEQGLGGGVFASSYATLAVTDCELSGNSAVRSPLFGGDGGAVYDLSEQSASYAGDLITANAASGPASEGGGIFSNDEAGDSITASTVSDNRADDGAGIYDAGTATGLRLLDSTVDGNLAGVAGTTAGLGGGLYLSGTALLVSSSTIADNTVGSAVSPSPTPGEGGGIYATAGGTDTVEYSTIAGNSGAVGAAYFSNGPAGALSSSIVADNVQPPEARPMTTARFAVSGDGWVSVGHNVLAAGATSCVASLASSDLVPSTVALAPLAENGGPAEATAAYPTETMALYDGSPAISAGGAPCPATDERGVARPQGLACDAGAYELAEGFWAATAKGSVVAAGGAPALGGPALHTAVVGGVTATPDHRGYWVVIDTGQVMTFGDARPHGSAPLLKAGHYAVGIASTPDAGGYWVLTAAGTVYRFGDAKSYGSVPALPKGQAAVGIAATADGLGYWVLTTTGKVYPLGDAAKYGSTPALVSGHLAVGIVATADGGGYWVLTSTGFVYRFGDAHSYGSVTAKLPAGGAAVSLVPTPDDAGYWILTAKWALYRFGDAAHLTVPAHAAQPLATAAGL